MNKLIFGFLILAFAACKKSVQTSSSEIIETEPAILKAVPGEIAPAIGGYYQALPVHYSTSGKKYPLLIFVHGAGQLGNGSNDLPLLLNEGVTQLLDEKKFPPNFNVDGKNDFSFVILAPQFRIENPSTSDVKKFLDHAMSSYRIDPSRIYLAGLSFGGRTICEFTADYPAEVTAFVPMSGEIKEQAELNEKAEHIATHNLPVWVFHNEDDSLINVNEAVNFVSAIKEFNPAIPPRLTIFKTPQGLENHDSWSRATDPSYKENQMNIYEWMLHYTK